MTCIRISSGYVCVNPWGRLKVGNRYVWLDFHPYCGPSFYTDSRMTKLYDPKDESDPVWEPFGKWLKKYQAAEAKKAAQKKGPNTQIAGPQGPAHR